MQNFGSYPMASGGMPSMMGMGAASSGAAGAGPKMMAAGPAVLGGPTDWNSMLRMIAGQRSLPGSGTTGSPKAQALGAEYGGPNANTKVFNPLGTAYTPGIMGGPAQNQVGPSPPGTVFNYEGGMGRMPQVGMPQMGVPQMGRPQIPQFNPGQAPQNRPSGMPSAAPVGNTAYTPGIMGGPAQNQPGGGPRTLPGPGTTKMPGQGGTAYTPGIMGGPSQSAASGYPGFGNMTNPNSLSAMMAAQRRGEASANEQAYQNRPGSSAADSQYDQQMQMINRQMGGGFRPEAGQSRLLNQSGPGAAYQGMASMGLPPSAIASQNAMMASLRNGTYQQPQAYMHPNMNQNYLGASASMMPFQMASGMHRGSIPVMGQPGRWTNG